MLLSILLDRRHLLAVIRGCLVQLAGLLLARCCVLLVALHLLFELLSLVRSISFFLFKLSSLGFLLLHSLFFLGCFLLGGLGLRCIFGLFLALVLGMRLRARVLVGSSLGSIRLGTRLFADSELLRLLRLVLVLGSLFVRLLALAVKLARASLELLGIKLILRCLVLKTLCFVLKPRRLRFGNTRILLLLLLRGLGLAHIFGFRRGNLALLAGSLTLRTRLVGVALRLFLKLGKIAPARRKIPFGFLGSLRVQLGLLTQLVGGILVQSLLAAQLMRTRHKHACLGLHLDSFLALFLSEILLGNGTCNFLG
eukprot:comp22483_c0_seq8/m.55759 comp22483_c0_seq8/g.55759  ORF comp22483_c0_seq8/g.55759 comp22483_c0_seq8/m.55759 type:complete len:310 (+) comp22483_c0_seq8:264-1193(+)